MLSSSITAHGHRPVSGVLSFCYLSKLKRSRLLFGHCTPSDSGMPPNATLQAPPMAEATQERRLLAVACKRLDTY